MVLDYTWERREKLIRAEEYGDGRAEGEKAGKKAGKHEERISVVKTMLANGYSEADCRKLGFTQEEIQEGRKYFQPQV